jgi:hypothetical protein
MPVCSFEGRDAKLGSEAQDWAEGRSLQERYPAAGCSAQATSYPAGPSTGAAGCPRTCMAGNAIAAKANIQM